MRIFGKIIQTLRISKRLSSSHHLTRRYSAIIHIHSKPTNSPSATNTTKLFTWHTKCCRFFATESGGSHTGDDKASYTMLSILRQHAKQIEPFSENLNEPTVCASDVADVHQRAHTEFEGHDELAYWLNKESPSNTANAMTLYENLGQNLPEHDTNKHVEMHDSFDIMAWNNSKGQIFAHIPKTLEEKLKQMSIASMQLAFEMDMTNVKDALMLRNNGYSVSPALQRNSLKSPMVTFTTCLVDDTKMRSECRVPLNFNALIQGTVELDSSQITHDQLQCMKVPEFNDCVTTIAANICSTALQKGFPADIGRMSYSTAASTSGGSKSRNPHIVCVREGKKGCVSPGNADQPKFEATGSGNAAANKAKTAPAQCTAPKPCPPPKPKPAGSVCPGLSPASSSPSGALGETKLMSCKDYKKALEEAAERRKALCEKQNDPCNKEPAKATKQSKSSSSGEKKPPSKPSSDGAKKPESKAASSNEKKVTSSKKDDPSKKKNDPCKKKKDDPCKKPEPCKKEDPCKKKDPCKKADSCQKPDPPCKNADPCKKDDPCKKKKDDPCKKKNDPCKKSEPKKKEDPCKPNPCKKEDPCKKSDPCKKADSCQKSESTCKKSDSCKKDDPCKKKDDPCKKKEDPCKKKEDPCKKKEDPCKKKEDPCKKKEDPCKKKEDPCKKKEDPCKKKEDPCKKKEDPCKKKEDPCKKKEDPCKKKEDPCKKKEDPCKKKEDPCKKKEDPCKKKEDPCKKKEDPCKKKEDPCKKKEDPCKKKEDPCKKKEDPCKKKEDPCKKKEDPCKKKEDPCKKKEDPCKKKEDPCKKKEDPCKKKEDPCKKKEDPCKKKEDPCKKKEDPCKKKEDPCKKKKDPCKKADSCQKDDPCKKKESPAKKKESPCDKKKDSPCKKKASKSKGSNANKTKDSGSGKCNPPEKKPNSSAKCNTADPCAALKKKNQCGQSSKPTKCNSPKPQKTVAGSRSSEKPKCGSVSEKRNDSSSKRGKSTCGKTGPVKIQPKPTCGAKQERPRSCSAPPKCCPPQPKCAKKEEPKKCCPPEPKCEKKEEPKKCCPPEPECEEAPKKTPCQKMNSKCKPPAPKCEEDDGDKRAVCPHTAEQLKRSTKPNCPSKGGDSSCKKSYSTSALHCEENSFRSTKPKCLCGCEYHKKFSTNTQSGTASHKSFSYSDLMKRHMNGFSFNSFRLFSSKKKSKVENHNCRIQPPRPAKRWNVTRRNKLTKCYDDFDGCPKKLCKDLKETACRGIPVNKKENKRIIMRDFNATTIAKEKWANTFLMAVRKFSTTNVKRTKMKSDDDHCDDISVEQTERMNEIIKIPDPGRILRVTDVIPHFSDYGNWEECPLCIYINKTPYDADVLIQTQTVALSGSDVHVYETGAKTSLGISLGHDAAGIIQKVGRCIYNFRPGDRVAIESGLSCGICDYCKRGLYNMCTQLIYNGFLCKYQVHPADLCHKIPYELSMEEATLSQCIAFGCQSCYKARISPMSNVLVIGCSPAAISTALCARAFGARNVCMAALQHLSLESIRTSFGINYVLYDECNQRHSEALEHVFTVLGDWPDVVVNCAVSEHSMNLAIMSLALCGTCVLAECDTECACFNAMDVLMKNLRILSSFRSTNMFPTAIHLMQSGQVCTKELIASICGWQDVETAFRTALHESNVGYKKVIVKCAEEENCHSKIP